jgi:signal transduction histidine kinase
VLFRRAPPRELVANPTITVGSASNGAPQGTVVRRRDLSKLKWWGVAVGLALGLADTWLLGWFGIRFEVNGSDVTMLAAGWFGASFAILLFLLGHAIDGRQREREALELVRVQMEALERSRARLAQSEKLAALGQLAAAIAHEVRNPLAVMRSAAQSLGEIVPPSDERARRTCAFITDETDRLGSLVTSLLAFARPVQLAPSPVAVGELFDHALGIAREELGRRSVRVERRVAGSLPALQADTELLGQVIVVLLSNAADAVPEGGSVVLEARAAGGQVELAVDDSGPGVPVELRGRIFEPFFTTRARGVGLGLAIARQVIEAHGGSIEVTDGAMGGARFRIMLPSASATEAAA